VRSVSELRKIERDIASLVVERNCCRADDLTDDRFKVQDKMRALSQRIHQITVGKKLDVGEARIHGR